MRTVEYRGTLTALTSIAHGGKDSGTVHAFRRESFVLPDGRLLPGVPVVSGGVVRGSLRRLAAAMTQDAIGAGGALPFPVVHALRTGGALRETRSGGEVLTGERQARLREVIPMLGVFGLSAGGRIMSGRLVVDKPLPLAQETLYLTEHYGVALDGYNPPSVWQLVQRESYARFADVNDSSAQTYIDADDPALRELPKGSGTMMWTHETLPPGTRLLHSLLLEDATAAEVSFFDDLVTAWSATARVGGQRARGLGRVRCDYTREVRDVAGRPVADEREVDWRQVLSGRAEDVQEALGWL